MNIAEQIHRDFTGKYSDDFVKRAEAEAVNIDQNWNNEQTVYTFKDDSKLTWSGPFLDLGGDKRYPVQ